MNFFPKNLNFCSFFLEASTLEVNRPHRVASTHTNQARSHLPSHPGLMMVGLAWLLGAVERRAHVFNMFESDFTFEQVGAKNLVRAAVLTGFPAQKVGLLLCRCTHPQGRAR